MPFLLCYLVLKLEISDILHINSSFCHHPHDLQLTAQELFVNGKVKTIHRSMVPHVKDEVYHTPTKQEYQNTCLAFVKTEN